MDALDLVPYISRIDEIYNVGHIFFLPDSLAVQTSDGVFSVDPQKLRDGSNDHMFR
jgi:hypothetical protein